MHAPTRIVLAFLLALLIHASIIILLFLTITPDPIPLISPKHEQIIALSLKNPLPIKPSTALKSNESKMQNRTPKDPVSSNPLVTVLVQTTDKPQEKPNSNTNTLTRITKEQFPDLSPSVQRHYGDEFFALSSSEQHYIINNLQKIRRINDIVGNRLLQTKSQENLENRDNNYVEFYLHPDGSISDLTLQNERTNSLLDELTLETIELAHTQYPKPEQTTLIRIRVFILVK
ncbi:MAG: hypothetical protein Q8K81_04870 [Sulfuricurvum sp.]|nr:hypothetical protein [Sulfuricurvum sp.]